MNDLKVLSDFNIKVQLQVEWADMDILGHVNSTKYFEYFESARVKYYHKLGLLDFFSKYRITGILSKIECNFLSQLSYPDTLTIGARVSEIFTDFMIMEYYVKSDLRGLSAIGDSNIVFYNFDKNIKVNIPKQIMDLIVKFEKQ